MPLPSLPPPPWTPANFSPQVAGWVAAYPQKSHRLLICIYSLHVLASGATTLNSPSVVPSDGCVAALPALFGTVLLTGIFISRLLFVRLQEAAAKD